MSFFLTIFRLAAAKRGLWQILNIKSRHSKNPEVKLVAKKPAKKEEKKPAKKK
jgi:hypothetical protein